MIRRSLPHGGRWPDVEGMINALAEHGDVGIVITMRERSAMIASQMANGHVPGPNRAKANISHALAVLGVVMAGFTDSVYMLPYESLVLHPAETERALLAWAGLDMVKYVPVYDGNTKYYHVTSEKGAIQWHSG